MENLAVNIPFHQRANQTREFGIARGRVVTSASRANAQGRHDAHVRVERGQRSLLFAKPVVRPVDLRATCGGPYLENVIIL
jgi:hypothetical protein